MDAELKELEAELERIAPNALPEGLISRMAAAMDGWQENEREEKVVPFPKQEEARPGWTGFWRAAAAVAILGAAAALLVPGKDKHAGTVAAVQPQAVSDTWIQPTTLKPAFSPVSAERNVVSAENQGRIVLIGGVPHQCVRVDSLDHVEYADQSGATIHVKKPAVDFMLIPLRPD